MTASSVAASAQDSTHATAPVKQWFRGEIEASYYGVPSRAPVSSSNSIGRRYRLHIYRAAMLRAEPIDSPDAMTQAQESEAAGKLFDAEDASGTQPSEPFFQASIEVAQLWGVRGPGTRYEGPIHDVSISQPQTRFHVMKDGKSYGTLRGYARGWLYLPSTATPEPAPPTELDRSDRVGMPTGVLIHTSPQENATNSIVADNRARAADREHESGMTVDEGETLDASIDDAGPALPRRMASSQKTEPPFFSLCAAAGLLLWFACGAEQTWIWCLFMLPTLGMRRLVFEVLPDDRGVQAFAAVTVLGAILSAGTIFASFSTDNCWSLEVVPLVVLVASVFLSGIVPYRLPLAIAALTFAGVLYVWGHAPERHCPPEVPSDLLPTIKDPGVPRTNDDGTWPRRVPTSENDPR